MERLLKTVGKILAAVFIAVFAAVASVVGIVGYGVSRGWQGLRKNLRGDP
jgi:small-conductance mechanosensitive channel